MTTPVLTFFNNKGGVGKTSLAYHLAWMFAETGKRVLAVDLDPQANLTSAFLDEDALAELWNSDAHPTTIEKTLRPLTETGDLLEPEVRAVGENLWLLPGDVALAGFEEALAAQWPDSMGDVNLYRPFRIITSFWQAAQMAATRLKADLILVDVGPNLGAINRSALIATDFVLIPLGSDLFSLQGLRNLGPALRTWRSLWSKRVGNWRSPKFPLPQGAMRPIGYVVQQYSVRLKRPVGAYDKWVSRMPGVYHEHVLGSPAPDLRIESDPECLARVKHYRSLIPMGQEARKPIFRLTPADGAIGSHAQAVAQARDDFRELARRLEGRMQACASTPTA